MPKDFKRHFTKDLGKAVVRGRKEVAKTITRSLIEKGPWWTGTFGENWIVSKTPVQPTRKRRPDFPNYLIPDPTPRQIKNPRVPNVTLREDLFVGNRAKYAGFAINAPGQTRPNLSGEPVTYEEHGKEGFKLTSTGGPNWYNIYTKGGLINKDIALAFKKVGFK
tara:strand:+ start:840 stop:1331 length:492 start_codon:yes stop_codon:yes gene_type:complete